MKSKNVLTVKLFVRPNLAHECRKLLHDSLHHDHALPHQALIYPHHMPKPEELRRAVARLAELGKLHAPPISAEEYVSEDHKVEVESPDFRAIFESEANWSGASRATGLSYEALAYVRLPLIDHHIRNADIGWTKGLMDRGFWHTVHFQTIIADLARQSQSGARDSGSL